MAKKGSVPEKIQRTDAFQAALAEFQHKPPDPTAKRFQLLRDLEQEWSDDTRVVAYVTQSPYGYIGSYDVGPIASVLEGMGRPKQLLVIINSDGGDAYAAEKIVHICRSHTRKLLVAVPDRAKSAATLVCLGADRIILGYLSELGPIDPQIPVIVSGEPQYISALSFIEAREALEEMIKKKEKANESVLAHLQELSGLDLPFIRECERKVAWSKQLAVRYLTNHMQRRPNTSLGSARSIARKVADNLSTAHLQHGEFIGPKECRRLGLSIIRLRKNEKKWQLLWNYYVRAALYLTMPPRREGVRISRMIETAETSLQASAVTG